MEFTGRCFCVFSCQNWEGGLSGVPGLEAHGGYTFCGTAALVILGKEHMLDLKSLLVRKLDIFLVRFSWYFEVLIQARTPPIVSNIYNHREGYYCCSQRRVCSLLGLNIWGQNENILNERNREDISVLYQQLSACGFKYRLTVLQMFVVQSNTGV